MALFRKGRSEGSLYKKIAVPFLCISALIAVAVFYIAFSWATITLTAEPRYTSHTIPVKVVDGVGIPGGAQDSIPGRVISTTLEGAGIFSATGSEEVVEHVHGVIIIVNKYSKDQPLRETTRLLSADGTLFRTESFVNAPSGGTVEVPVVADKPGEIPEMSGSKFTLPALWPGLQDQIYGTGFEVRTAGSSKIKLVSQKDVDLAAESVAAQLEKQFRQTLEGQGGSAWTPLKGQIIVEHKILSSVPDKAVGTKAEQFSEHVKVVLKGVVYDQADLVGWAKRITPTLVPKGTQVLDLSENDIISKLVSIDTDESGASSASLTVSINAGTVLAGDATTFSKKRLVGMTATDIEEYFKSYEGIKETSVKFYPFWVTRAPFLIDHIHILIKK